MSSQKQSSPPLGVFIAIGTVVMIGGFYVSLHKLISTEALAQMGIELDLGMTISTIGAFLLLFPIINFFFITPLHEAIDHRNTELETAFEDSESLRTEMQQLKADYEKRLAATEAQAREEIQAQIKEAQNLRQTLMTEAADRADELVKKAEQEIEQEKQRALTEIRLQIVDLTLSATEKVLGEVIDKSVGKRLVEEFIENFEVAR